MLPGFIIAGLLLSIVNGLYPAFVMTSFDPVRVLKGKIGGSKKGIGLRNALVIVQFAASIFLIISTISISRQLNLVQSGDLGFSKENIMMINTNYLESHYVLKTNKRIEHINIAHQDS